MKTKLLTPDVFINAILTIFFAYAWWLMFPGILARIFIISGIILLWVIAFASDYYFEKSKTGKYLQEKSESVNYEIKNYFKKIPVLSNPSFWLFIIALFVSWTYYQENQAFASKNIFIIILLIATPFLSAILFTVIYPLRDKLFDAKTINNKIMWGVITAVVTLILAGPYIFFAYNVILNIMASTK